MRKATDSLVDQGSREDLPTGSTPRKRVWQYTDNWELTEDRDTIIQGWKRRAAQSQDDESDFELSSARRGIPPVVSSGCLGQPHLPSVAAQPEPTLEPSDSLPPPYLEADAGQPLTSNLPLPDRPLLLASSVVPMALPSAVSHPTTKTKMGKGGSDITPAMGTLTERSTNLIYNRGTRRAR